MLQPTGHPGAGEVAVDADRPVVDPVLHVAPGGFGRGHGGPHPPSRGQRRRGRAGARRRRGRDRGRRSPRAPRRSPAPWRAGAWPSMCSGRSYQVDTAQPMVLASDSGVQVVEHEAGAAAGRLVVVARRCRPGRRSRARPAACRSAGCTSGSGRTARSATASGRSRRPPRCGGRGRCRSGARRGSDRRGARRPRRRSARRRGRRCRAARSARPSSGCASSACASTSNPFCGVSRPTMPNSGTSGRTAQAGLLLQRRLARRLAGQVARVEVRRQVRVGRRVPLVGVDAVQDADQIAAAPREHAVEAAAVGAGLDLARVGRADRRQQRAVVERAPWSGSSRRSARARAGCSARGRGR